MFLLAYIILFLTNFVDLLYYVWTFVAFAINGIYVAVIFFTMNPAGRHHDKTVEKFFIMFGLCIVIPQVFNWIVLYETLRIYMILPVNITLFMAQLDFSVPQERTKKMIVNLILTTLAITTFYWWIYSIFYDFYPFLFAIF